ncbi:YjzC family protein [Sphingopyxis sp. H115]|uniref:YjzC family protein n=1 Tax=Sphingopyxis sp. H115 TaxID=1759073 RepID=UPI000AB40DDC|nr:YjzC family protein [Sphingopyxis sp. H115]
MKNPGSSSGKNGGIYQEVGPRGGRYDNYSTVPDNTRLPPTTTPGRGWTQVRRTPDSKR